MEGGLPQEIVEAIWSTVLGLYRTRMHPAISMCVRRHGRLVLNRAIGHLAGNSPPGAEVTGAPLIPIRHDSLFNVFSASKAITSMAIHLLDERRQVHLDDAVTEYIPEFGRHGKEWITIRHILTHRAGIPAAPSDTVDPSVLQDEARMLQLMCEMRPLSVPGRRLAYHALTGGFVLGEIVKRVTGRNIRDFLGTEILAPLGIQHLNYGVPPAETELVAKNAYTGAMPLPPYSWFMKRALGAPVEDVVRLTGDPRFLTAIVPSGNIIGTAEEASRFFELLLRDGELEGVRIFDRRTVRRAVAEQSFLEIDSFLGVPVRYGMGFMLGSRWFSIYGTDTGQAFGHLGFTNIIVWADPARDISVALLTSGKPFITPEQFRWLNVAHTIARLVPKI